jgi:hypothetical protein
MGFFDWLNKRRFEGKKHKVKLLAEELEELLKTEQKEDYRFEQYTELLKQADSYEKVIEALQGLNAEVHRHKFLEKTEHRVEKTLKKWLSSELKLFRKSATLRL